MTVTVVLRDIPVVFPLLLVEELQQLRLVLHHLLTPGVGLGAIEQVGPTAQLLLKHRPERRFWTQNLKTMDSGVNAALSQRGGGGQRRQQGEEAAGGPPPNRTTAQYQSLTC